MSTPFVVGDNVLDWLIKGCLSVFCFVFVLKSHPVKVISVLYRFYTTVTRCLRHMYLGKQQNLILVESLFFFSLSLSVGHRLRKKQIETTVQCS